MKKTMILAAFAALVSFASCQKEDVIDNKGTDKNASPVFTASIAGATKTTVDLTDGKVAWEGADEITITDASSASAVYAIESIDETTGKATFAIKSGETALGDGPYTATYGTEPATVQTYSATAGKLYMTAPETSNNSFTFTVQCGLMKLNLTKTGESVKSIAVTSSTDATYTLTCDPAESIATAKDFCIALPAGSYTKIEITNASDVKATLNSTSGVTVAANHIKPVTLGESKINFAPALPDGALSGKFTINAAGDQVYISQGNLWYGPKTEGVSATFNFETNQYDISSSWNASHVSNFFWSKTASSAYADDYDYLNSDNDVLFTNATETTPKADFTVNGNAGVWRTLSRAEWQYLLRNHTYKYVPVNDKYGIVIAPDGFSGTIEDSYAVSAWAVAEAAGLVFLPSTGYRDGGFINEVSGDTISCIYWTSTAVPDNEENAYRMFFKWEDSKLNTDFDADGWREWAAGIRLVSDVK